jgi:hypothetical protein
VAVVAARTCSVAAAAGRCSGGGGVDGGGEASPSVGVGGSGGASRWEGVGGGGCSARSSSEPSPAQEARSRRWGRSSGGRRAPAGSTRRTPPWARKDHDPLCVLQLKKTQRQEGR